MSSKIDKIIQNIESSLFQAKNKDSKSLNEPFRTPSGSKKADKLKVFGAELFQIAKQTGQSFAIVADAATEFSKNNNPLLKDAKEISE